MNESLCPSCGHKNESTLVYCAHCGGILSRPPFEEGNNRPSLPASVSVAARRVQMKSPEPKASRSLISRLFSLLIYAVLVALGVSVSLMVMEPREIPSVTQPVPDPMAVIERAFSASRYNPSVISQPVINELFRTSGRVEWKSPVDFIPVPEWAGNRVTLENNGITYFLNLRILKHPLCFSENFQLAGGPHQWRLEPTGGTIGLFSFTGPCLRILTTLMAASVVPFRSELKLLENADTLSIQPGLIGFTTR